MKKLISALLIVAITLGLCACGASAPAATTAAPTEAISGLQVGYAKANITPEYSVPLAGYGNTSTRMSKGMLDYIYTTAIAISDGSTTVVIIENDLTAAVPAVLDKVRKQVNEKTGIPVENIMAAVDHIHSGPDLWNTGESSISKYSAELVDIMAKNAMAAVTDMKPAQLFFGSGETKDVSFVRHYLLEDGNVRGPNFGLQYDSPKVGHTHEPDTEMQVLQIVREDAKEIVLVNWQCHPQRVPTNDYYSISADTIGVMRDYVSKKRDCEVIYILGAAGDLESISLIQEENVYSNHKDHGQALGEAVLGILGGSMEAVEGDQIRTQKSIYTATVDKTENHKLTEAQAIRDQWNQDNDFNAAVAAGAEYGINSPYHANAIVTKSGLADTVDMELFAFGVGEIGFVFAPYEMFCENGAYIKANSPFTATVVCSMANAQHNYISSVEGFEYNCYEANTCRYIKGTAEELADHFVTMLKDIH